MPWRGLSTSSIRVEPRNPKESIVTGSTRSADARPTTTAADDTQDSTLEATSASSTTSMSHHDHHATPSPSLDNDDSGASQGVGLGLSTSCTDRLLPPEQASYIDPTPSTPVTSRPPSRDPSAGGSKTSFLDKPNGSDDEGEGEGGSQSEIQSIMEQFSGESGGGPGVDEVMSPRLEIASPMLGGPAPQHPPRKSSLEPLAPSIAGQLPFRPRTKKTTTSPSPAASVHSSEPAPNDRAPPVPPKDGTHGTPPRHHGGDKRRPPSIVTSPTSPQLSMHRPPPPEPEPEPALPFDFHRFLEQLRNKKADPVARYLKSFLAEFGKRQWMVHEQVKIISDFLAFIANKMVTCEVWRDVSDAEFDNAREGMEKLVMNRLYTQTFSPAIPPPKPIPGAKPRRKGGDPPMGPGRRGQHQEDVERDDIVTQKINIYGWVKEEHLDIPPVGDSGRRFLKLAQQELLKIKTYRAPRDKIICVLNCCKVIFGLLKHNKSDSSADSFMPLLIYVVLQSNPEHLVSNVQYILRFRNQDKLGGEAGYYLSSLMGAVQFIENMDRTSLTISDDDFEKAVEASVSAIAERHPQSPKHDPGPSRPSIEEGAPMSGLLRTIQNPLSTIGRIFSDEPAPRAHEHVLSAEEAAARQANAENVEAQRLHRAEHANVVETLAGMFPDLDRDIISDVVYQKEGRVGLAVDACLALST